MSLASLPPAAFEQARQQLGIKPKPCTMEKELLRLCCHELSRRNIPFLHLSHKAREKAGWPDLTFCHRGEFYGIELKRPGGVVSEDQARTLAELREQGAVAEVVNSYEAFVKLLEGK